MPSSTTTCSGSTSSDVAEGGQGGSRGKDLAAQIAAIEAAREKHKAMLAQLDRTGESQISLTDPDSRAMAAHNRQACRECPLRSQCTAYSYRSVSRFENEAVSDRMQARIERHPDILSRRREMVEHPFGSIKQWMHQGAFLMRGLQKVHGEFSLTALAYNLRRVLNLVGVPGLMAALRA